MYTHSYLFWPFIIISFLGIKNWTSMNSATLQRWRPYWGVGNCANLFGFFFLLVHVIRSFSSFFNNLQNLSMQVQDSRVSTDIASPCVPPFQLRMLLRKALETGHQLPLCRGKSKPSKSHQLKGSLIWLETSALSARCTWAPFLPSWVFLSQPLLFHFLKFYHASAFTKSMAHKHGAQEVCCVPVKPSLDRLLHYPSIINCH